MVEVLYCPKNDQLLLFRQRFQFDPETTEVTVILDTYKPKSIKKKVRSEDLIHIGWL